MTRNRTILLAGESWSTTSVHTKGFDTFHTTSYEEGAWPFIRSLEKRGWTVEFQPNHVASLDFPYTAADLDKYDVVVLSDIGANTLLLTQSVFTQGKPARSNRLRVLAEWVRAGGALLMVGGYLSFQGIEAKANYRSTPLADVLPVLMEVGDDREEVPEGVHPLSAGSHDVTAGLAGEWPAILGYQRFTTREGAEVVATAGDHPLVVVGEAGEGRVAAVATDMGPHWLPADFIAWDGYGQLWDQLIGWLADSGTREEA